MEQEIKEKLDRSARNARRLYRSGTPGNARGAPTEHFQQKNIYISMFIRVSLWFVAPPRYAANMRTTTMGLHFVTHRVQHSHVSDYYARGVHRMAACTR